MSNDVAIAKSYKRDVLGAINDLISSGQQSVSLKHPSAGEYVSYEKPQENGALVLVGAYDLKSMSLSTESKMVYHVIDNPMGPSKK